MLISGLKGARISNIAYIGIVFWTNFFVRSGFFLYWVGGGGWGVGKGFSVLTTLNTDKLN